MSRLHLPRRAAVRARLADQIGRRLIAVGGIGIVAAVLAIFLFILREAWPLLEDPSVQAVGQRQPVASGFAVLLDPYGRSACVVDAGGPAWVRLDREETGRPESWTGAVAGTITAAGLSARGGLLAVATADHHLVLGQITFPAVGRPTDAGADLAVLDTLTLPLTLAAAEDPWTGLAIGGQADGRVVVAGLTAGAGWGRWCA
ncbi:MAG: hypothetical protein WDA75_14780, partial [Candidatus Latescibacterota bacterium]